MKLYREVSIKPRNFFTSKYILGSFIFFPAVFEFRQEILLTFHINIHVIFFVKSRNFFFITMFRRVYLSYTFHEINTEIASINFDIDHFSEVKFQYYIEKNVTKYFI